MISDATHRPPTRAEATQRERGGPAGVLIQRLEEFTALTEADRVELTRLCSQATRTIPAKRSLIQEGDAPRSLYLILEGWAARYRDLDNGRRQIVDFAVPGDLCDLNLFILDVMDHSIAAITRLRVVEISREVFHRIITTYPNITTALWWQELVSKSIHRERIVSIGQRCAQERVAHLLCEMFLRLESVGLSYGYSCDFPLTQTQMAEATGLTAVHVNRTLQELRRKELVELERQRLTIPDMLALQQVALFNSGYLHHRRLNQNQRPGSRQRLRMRLNAEPIWLGPYAALNLNGHPTASGSQPEPFQTLATHAALG